jgi:hypothetical protein
MHELRYVRQFGILTLRSYIGAREEAHNAASRAERDADEQDAALLPVPRNLLGEGGRRDDVGEDAEMRPGNWDLVRRDCLVCPSVSASGRRGSAWACWSCPRGDLDAIERQIRWDPGHSEGKTAVRLVVVAVRGVAARTDDKGDADGGGN